ncbi:MAG: leader peptide processing enzyme [Treponema sp.]|jgi:ABC-type sugar transport system permease subunit|nr:leader peptide processing enzyme [Treponema sp.]
MNKRVNTLLFVLGATVFNVLLYIVSLLLLMLLYSQIVGSLPESVQQWGIIVILILPLAVSFVVYRLILKVLLKKFDAEKYFAPLFSGRRPPRKLS